MSTFKTRSEMSTGLELIQVLEELRSGSLAGPDGINRSLERLGENDDALFGLAQTAANTVITGGGTLSFPGSASFNWSSSLAVRWPDSKGGVASNVITTGSGVGARTMVDNGGVAYVVLDRATDGAAVVLQYAASMAALLAVMAATDTRADFLIIAYRDGSICVLADGRRIIAGQMLSSNGSVDSQYAQQSAFAAVETRLPQNFNVILTGGGQVSWDAGADELTWSDTINVLIPGRQSGNRILATTKAFAPGKVLYATLDRATGAGGGELGSTITVSAATYHDYAALQTNDTLVLAYHHSDGRVYLWNGQSLGDGDVAAIGGSISGVQWAYRQYGDTLQALDFTLGGLYPTRTYPVGTGALMLYRNGIKQKASLAFWGGGTYPFSGALDTGAGSIDEADDYLEEDDGTGTGSRIIWLRDVDAPDADADELAQDTYRYADVNPGGGIVDGSSHDPAHTWPGASDWIEGFIGIQGQGPSPVESVGIDGDPGVPLDGDVLFEAGTGIALDYNAGKLRISVGTGAGVASLNGLSGALNVIPGTGISVSAGGTDVEVSLDAELSDIKSVSDDMQAAFVGALLPTLSNPYLTALTIEAVQGFDHVWCYDSVNLRCAGGRLSLRGGSSAHVGTAEAVLVSANIGDVFPSDTLVVNNWLYAYLTHPIVSANSQTDGATDVGDDRIFTSAAATFLANIPTSDGAPLVTTYISISGVGSYLVQKVVSNTELRIEPGASTGLSGQAYSIEFVSLDAPQMVLASLPPDRSVMFGVHPGAGRRYAFLASVWYPGIMYPFSKDGNWVTLGEALDASASFAGAIAVMGTWAHITIAPLPATVGGAVRLRLRVPVVDPVGTIGYQYQMLTRTTGSASFTTHSAILGASTIKPDASVETCDFVMFEFDVQVDSTGSFDIKLPNTTYTTPSPVAPNTTLGAWVLGYAEPRSSAAADAMEP